MDNVEIILKCLLDHLEEGIQIVDSFGKTVYYNEAMGKIEGINPQDVLGKKVVEYLKGVEEDSSTLMNALKNDSKYVDVVQHYSSHYRKEITTINTTIPIKQDNAIIGALEISKDMTKLKELTEKICKLQDARPGERNYYTFKDIIGESKPLKAAINKAIKASLSNSSVLIYGETGCGKELFAQSIHYNGIRKDKPFVPINCAAIPSTLLEAMLFGTVKGSFTGAENKQGLFEVANGGTILLDEVNSMDTTLQSKLLRVLQEGYLRPVGSNKDIDIDVRIIATLNEDPEKLIIEGKLRKDFYYRLSVIRIDVPSLRERTQDIKLLAEYFIKQYNLILNKNIVGLDADVLALLAEYSWPGNIRELKNIIESAMNMIDANSYISKEYVENRITKSYISDDSKFKGSLENLGLDNYLENTEKEIISEALRKFKFNLTKTAAYLKISRQNLQHKVKKYKLL